MSVRYAKYFVAMFFFAFSSCFTLNPSYAGTINRIDTSGDQITITFDGLMEGASAFSLMDPDRIEVDVKGAKAGRDSDASGVIKSVRQGQFDPNTTRIVFDLKRPVIVSGGEFSADGLRLTLNLQSGNDRAAKSVRKSFVPPPKFRAEPTKKAYNARVPLGRQPEKATSPKIYGSKDQTRPLVVIDAGHGGHDPGAISPYGGQREKNLTLAIAGAIRDRLVASGRVRVALTRESDKFLVLEERYGIARRLGADLFISIHADAAANQSESGATVYTLSEVASDREAAKLATRENKANIINGINLGGTNRDVPSVLIDLTQREKLNVSADFAKLLVGEGGKGISFRKTPHKFASFVVLKAPDTPSVLIETGYLTNKGDVAFLGSASGRAKMATSLTNAIEAHFARRLAHR